MRNMHTSHSIGKEKHNSMHQHHICKKEKVHKLNNIHDIHQAKKVHRDTKIIMNLVIYLIYMYNKVH